MSIVERYEKNSRYLYTKFVSEICKLTRNSVHDRIFPSLCHEFVNSFARRQHLLDMTAKPIDVNLSFISYRAPLFLPVSTLPKHVII